MLRFTRRLTLIPGLRVNISKSGASLSIGHRGAWYTIGPRGQRATLGIPGTGIYWTEQIPRHAPAPNDGHRFNFLGFALVVAAVLWICAASL